LNSGSQITIFRQRGWLLSQSGGHKASWFSEHPREPSRVCDGCQTRKTCGHSRYLLG